MFALDLISRAFTGRSLEQLEADRLFHAKYQEAIDEMRHVTGALRMLMLQYNARTFSTDGLNTTLGSEGLWVVNHDPQAGTLWARYLFLSGMVNGIAGQPPASGIVEPIYLRAYAEAFELRSSYGLTCADISPDFLDYCRQL